MQPAQHRQYTDDLYVHMGVVSQVLTAAQHAYQHGSMYDEIIDSLIEHRNILAMQLAHAEDGINFGVLPDELVGCMRDYEQMADDLIKAVRPS